MSTYWDINWSHYCRLCRIAIMPEGEPGGDLCTDCHRITLRSQVNPSYSDFEDTCLSSKIEFYMEEYPQPWSLWLDTEQPAPDDWIPVTSVRQAIVFMEHGTVGEISVNPECEDASGYALLEWFEERIEEGEYLLPRLCSHGSNSYEDGLMIKAIAALEEKIKV